MGVYPQGWTATCEEPGCHWWAHLDTREKAEQSLAAHAAHAHPRRCPWSYDYDDGNSGVARCARAEGHDGDCDPRLHGYGRFRQFDPMAFKASPVASRPEEATDA